MKDQESAIDRIVHSNATKSDRIRKLDELGLARADIARALGIRYQFVRNVLVDDERRRAAHRTGPPPESSLSAPLRHPSPAEGAERGFDPGAPANAAACQDRAVPTALTSPDMPSTSRLPPARTTLAPGGQLTIPEPFLTALGVKEEDDVFLQLEGDKLHIYSRATAIKQVQELVARYVPPDVSLVDTLVTERRRESQSEGDRV